MGSKKVLYPNWSVDFSQWPSFGVGKWVLLDSIFASLLQFCLTKSVVLSSCTNVCWLLVILWATWHFVYTTYTSSHEYEKIKMYFAESGFRFIERVKFKVWNSRQELQILKTTYLSWKFYIQGDPNQNAISTAKMCLGGLSLFW